MLTKEYRVPLPLTLDEYRIAQLYMIQKKSRLESTGAGSGVEILENRPYTEGPGGEGQYTRKIYHIGSHLPAWLKSLLPKNALQVEEEAWNAFPYTKTRHTCPFIDKFHIDIETHYLPDCGDTENIFHLSKTERKNTAVDLVDPIKDEFPQKDYKEDEDPLHFVSQKTKRGPLTADWLQRFKDGNVDGYSIMCAYKLIRVEFKYWGMQSKIEHFIHGGLRNPILVGHRQAWSWQDEWWGMTIEDIRALESQAQCELSERMGHFSNAEEGQEGSTQSNNTDSTIGSTGEAPELTMGAKRALSLTEQKIERCMKSIEQTDEEAEDDEFYDALDTLSIDEIIPQHFEHSTQDEEKHSAVETVFFVLHGGSITTTTTEENTHVEWQEFETFEKLLTSSGEMFFPGARNSLHLKLVRCSPVARDVVQALNTALYTSRGTNFPFSCIPQLLAESADFQPAVDEMIEKVNRIYQRMLENLQPGVQLQVYFLADCIGGLFAYHALQSANEISCSASCDSFTEEGNGTMERNSTEEDLTQPTLQNEVFDFLVTGLFTFGSPVAMLALRDKLSHKGKHFTVSLRILLKSFGPLSKIENLGANDALGLLAPHCGQVYNLFHPFDPFCSRLEPLLDHTFIRASPSQVPRYQCFPYSREVQYHCIGLSQDHLTINSTKSLGNDNWWGEKRLDYLLHCPFEEVDHFSTTALHQLCYNNYWESKDLVTFVLWQVLAINEEAEHTTGGLEMSGTFLDQLPVEKWKKRGTKIKIKNMNGNHRANDTIAEAGNQAKVEGKFTYGPVDIAALDGERVDIYIARRPQMNEWSLIGSETTDKHGRIVHNIGGLEAGVYAVRMIVRGDHSMADCNLAVVPRGTEAVVFSIDSSFLQSVSLRGKNPKIRGGAVDVVRHWQEMGYLIIYASSRLLFQKYKVVQWLAEHNFPFGILSFGEHVTTDYQKHKVDFLRNVANQEHVSLHAVYGGARDLSVYVNALHLSPSRVFLINKKSKKDDKVQWITEGYAEHLEDLKHSLLSVRSSQTTFLSLGTLDQQRKKRGLSHTKSAGETAPNNTIQHTEKKTFIFSKNLHSKKASVQSLPSDRT